MDSLESVFSWDVVQGRRIPYVLRFERCCSVKYTSKWMTEKLLLDNLLRALHPTLVACARVPCYREFRSETRALNKILKLDNRFDNDSRPNGDSMVRLDDVVNVYTFLLHMCKLLNGLTNGEGPYGFVYGPVASLRHAMPYVVKDGERYVPALYLNNVDPETVRRIGGWEGRAMCACFVIQSVQKTLFEIGSAEAIDVVHMDVLRQAADGAVMFQLKILPRVIRKVFLRNVELELEQGQWTGMSLPNN